ncbi:MAG: hypothetical protein ABR598_00285 [Candidatus Dormibacteria bacterium]
MPAAAAPADTHQLAYRMSLARSREVLRAATGTDATRRAAEAARVLHQGAPTELEAISAVEAQPPRLAEAESRVDAALRALDQVATDPDPAATNARLQGILAESRYHPDQGPLAFVRELFTRFLGWLTQPGAALFKWILILLVAGLTLLAIALLVPALRGPLLRRRKDSGLGAPAADVIPEYFREAEASAARGDHGGAIRALTAGTMELISGNRSFAASPLTVRETFSRAGTGPVLRPLLLAFERSYYGHHEPTAADYLAASAAARAFQASLGSAGTGVAA